MKIKYVSSFRDSAGIRRYRFRKTGLPTHYFNALPGTDGFEAEYAACLEGSPPRKLARQTNSKRPLVWQARKAMKKMPQSDGYVYFIGPRGGPVKIGLACDPARRMKDIQIGNHAKLELWALIPGTRETERKFHQRLDEWKMWGEWFEPSPEVLVAIAEARGLSSMIV